MQLPNTIEIHGIKVLTTRQLANAYGTVPEIINNNFYRNKDRYILGKHYISVAGEEMRSLRTSHQIDGEFKRVSRAYLWTEKGALLHAKSLNTDKAWEVYDYLVDFYFRAKEKQEAPKEMTYREKREAALAEQRAKAVAKSPVRKVVDVPENYAGQRLLRNLSKRILAMEVLLEEINRYSSEESFESCKNGINEIFVSIVPQMAQFAKFKPELIEKAY